MEQKTENVGYWTGPYGVLVPNDINSVVAEDGYNTTRISGETTEMFMENAPDMNAEIYRSRYCVLKDGNYYYSY